MLPACRLSTAITQKQYRTFHKALFGEQPDQNFTRVDKFTVKY